MGVGRALLAGLTLGGCCILNKPKMQPKMKNMRKCLQPTWMLEEDLLICMACDGSATYFVWGLNKPSASLLLFQKLTKHKGKGGKSKGKGGQRPVFQVTEGHFGSCVPAMWPDWSLQ